MIYSQTKVGEFAGALDVRWVKPDQFLFVPNKDDPFRYTTGDKRIIRPSTMSTDGGSVPRLFWSVPGYSPWGYGPAYVIHDWLFEAHRCKLPSYADIEFEYSASILAEAIKTLMENGTAPRDETTMVAIYEAVRSPLAKRVWDAPTPCSLPSGAAFAPDAQPPGELLLTITMTRK